MDALVLVEVPAGERELGVLGPHTRPDDRIPHAGLLGQLTRDRVLGGLAAVDAATGQLPPRRLRAVGRIARTNEQDAPVGIEAHHSCGDPADDKTHGAEP